MGRGNVNISRHLSRQLTAQNSVHIRTSKYRKISIVRPPVVKFMLYIRKFPGWNMGGSILSPIIHNLA